MVVNEKALEHRMKEAYKAGGYIVAVRTGAHVFQTPSWVAQINSENLPRNIAGLLAAHLGFLPEVGRAYRITKTKEGPYVEDVIFEEALRAVTELEEQTEAAGVKRTGLTLDGMRVWQRVIGAGVELMAPENEALIRKWENITLVGDEFRAVGGISSVWIMRETELADADKVAALSGFRWTA